MVMVHDLKPKRLLESDAVLRLIGLFKLFKGIVLLLVGVELFHMLHKNVAEEVTHWILALQADPHSRYFHLLISKLGLMDDHRLKQFGAGSLFYAVLLLTEGTGLLLRKHWAEYFTIFVTGSLIPLEVYELVKHARIIKIVILIVNVAIVMYLIARVQRERLVKKTSAKPAS